MKLLSTKSITAQLSSLNKKAQTEKVQELLLSLIVHAHTHADYAYIKRTILKLKDIQNGNKAVAFFRKHSNLTFSKKGVCFKEGDRKENLTFAELEGLELWNEKATPKATLTDEQKAERAIKSLLKLGLDSAQVIDMMAKLK